MIQEKVVKFKRNWTTKDKAEDIVFNSMYKSQFTNEDLYYTNDRDMFPFVLDMLTDTNTASVFETILVAYKEVDYNESVLQQIVGREHQDENIHRSNIGETYATTSPINIKFYRCVFMANPALFRNDKFHEINNTLKVLNTKYSDFTVVKKVTNFLENQLIVHQKLASPQVISDLSKNLLYDDKIVTLIVPVLEDNMFYKTNGVVRVPYLTESYYHVKTRYDQIRFIFKSKVMGEGRRGSKYIKKECYFDKGNYTNIETGEVTEIFYIKIFGKYFNPFMFFDIKDINGLLTELAEDPFIKEHTAQLVANTALVYYAEVDNVRFEYDNFVPSILVTKDGDSYYDEARERIQDRLKMNNINQVIDDLPVDDDLECCDDDEREDVVVEQTDETLLMEEGTEDTTDDSVPEISLSVEDLDEIDAVNTEMEKIKREDIEKQLNAKVTKLPRYSLSIKKLKNLIMGYNGAKRFGYYSHIHDVMLQATDLNDVKIRSGEVENVRKFPKSYQIIASINNDQLFATNDSTNPLDYKYTSIYKKSLIHTANPDGKTTTKEVKISESERYLSMEDVGIIDFHTNKSDNSSGLIASINFLKCAKDHILLTDR
ncbi:MAG: hypothetical protein ACRC92_20505 [Peptostreptococcaceae bacterium]